LMPPIFMVVPFVLATLVVDASPPSDMTVTTPPDLTREDIRAARDKFDREMKLDTKRPWDKPKPPARDGEPAQPKTGTD